MAGAHGSKPHAAIDEDAAVGDVAHVEMHLPHGSWWPFLLACAMAVLGLSVLLFGHNLTQTLREDVLGEPSKFHFDEVPAGYYAFMALGLAALLGVLAGWFKEDIKWWASNTGTGLHIPKAGTLLFISSEIFLFGGLFAAYFTFKSQPGFLPHEEGGEAFSLPLLKTFIFSLFLFASSGTIHKAEVALKAGRHAEFRRFWWMTVLLGAIFLAGQAWEYTNLVREGHTLGSSPFISAFYMLTGTHGAHVLGGLIVLSVVGIRAQKGQFDAKRHALPECASIYWHFVDIVWVVVYGVLYLVNFLPQAIHDGTLLHL